MPNQQLVDYIQQSLARGSSEEEIKDALLKEGWPTEEVERALSMAGGVSLVVPNDLPVQMPQTGFSETGTASGFSSFSETNGRLPGFFSLYKETFSIFFNNWRTLLGITILPFGFRMIVGLILGTILSFGKVAYFGGGMMPFGGGIPTTGSNVSIPFIAIFVLLGIVYDILALWSSLALIFTLKERARGAGIFESFGQTKNQLLSAMLIGILTMLAVWGGMALLVVPGIIVGVWFMFSSYALVYENFRGRKALFRSKQLVQGNWWGVFGRFILFGLSIVVPYVIISLSLDAMFASMRKSSSELSSMANAAWITVTSIFIISLAVIFAALLFEKLKIIKGEEYTEPPKGARIFTHILFFLGPLFIVGLPIILVNVGSVRERARDAARLSDQKQIKTTLEIYHDIDSHNRYPDSLMDLVPQLMSVDNMKDPTSHALYEYQVLSDGQDFKLCVNLEETKTKRCADKTSVGSGISPSFQGSLEGQPYENLKYGFSITPPKDWTVDESGQIGDAVFFSGPTVYTNDGKPIRINISATSESTKLSLNEYVQASKSMLSKTIADYQLIEDRAMSVSGGDAYIIGGVFSSRGFRIRNRQLIIVKNGKALIATATNLDSDWDRYDDLISASFSTFKPL